MCRYLGNGMAADEKAVLDLSDTAKVKPRAIFPPALPCPSLSTVTGDLIWIFYTGSNPISTFCPVYASDTQNILIDSELAQKKAVNMLRSDYQETAVYIMMQLLQSC